MSGGAVKLISAHNRMKRVLQMFGTACGLSVAFNLSMLITYVKDADIAESKLQDNARPTIHSKV